MKFVILLALHDTDILHVVDAVARPAAEPGIIRVLPAALCVFRATKRLVQPIEHGCGLFARDERIRAKRSILVAGDDAERRRDSNIVILVVRKNSVQYIYQRDAAATNPENRLPIKNYLHRPPQTY